MTMDGFEKEPSAASPLWMLAELTYRCPLQCPYCSNPTELAQSLKELSVEQWCDALEQARELGAVQLGLSGGEPLLKPGLEKIVQHAHELGFFTNLITSGLGLTPKKIKALKDAGLDHIQLSLQAPTEELNDSIAGRRCFQEKLRAAELIKSFDFPMVLNVVLHRQNIALIREIIELALEWKADYLELANTQFDAWAYLNRNVLLPSLEEVQYALKVTEEYQLKAQDRLKIFYVMPDYFSNRPKACCNGWGKMSLAINPVGNVLPCLGAQKLPIGPTPNIQSASLKWIWESSPLFNSFRGYSWMKEPCRSCPERFKDFGGCRCQAFLLTGDARNTDPVCSLSPHRDRVDQVLPVEGRLPFENVLFRSIQNSKKLF